MASDTELAVVTPRSGKALLSSPREDELLLAGTDAVPPAAAETCSMREESGDLESDSESGLSDLGSSHSTRSQDTWRAYLVNLLVRPDSSPTARALHYAMIGLIFGSTVLTIVETMPESREYRNAFLVLDQFVTAFFTLELAVRIYISESWCSFCSNLFNLVDCVAITPGYLETMLLLCALRDASIEFHVSDVLTAASSMRTLRLIRIFRLVRVMRVMRLAKTWHYAKQMRLLFRVMRPLNGSSIHVILMLLLGTAFVASGLMYAFESPDCPDRWSLQHSAAEAEPVPMECRGHSHFDSIPSAFWWAVITLTTVGYGDVVPITVMGKVVGGVTSVCAVLIISISAALISVHVRASWPEEKARAEYRPSALPAVLAKDHAEVEELLTSFRASLETLVEKLTHVSMRVDHSNMSPAMMPFFTSLKEQSNAISAEVSDYVYEVSLEAAHKTEKRPAPTLTEYISEQEEMPPPPTFRVSQRRSRSH